VNRTTGCEPTEPCELCCSTNGQDRSNLSFVRERFRQRFVSCWPMWILICSYTYSSSGLTSDGTSCLFSGGESLTIPSETEFTLWKGCEPLPIFLPLLLPLRLLQPWEEPSRGPDDEMRAKSNRNSTSRVVRQNADPL